MTQISRETATQLPFEFYKSVLTFALATLGGEITLLYSLFKESPRKGVAYASLIVIMFSCLFILGAVGAVRHSVWSRSHSLYRICPSMVLTGSFKKLSCNTPALQFNIATSGGQQVNLTK
jgi:hypothetical protein